MTVGSSATPLPFRRKLLFALVTWFGAAVILMVLPLAIDVYAHLRTQDLGGVNIWGYRGAPVGARQPGQVRVVMVGGSTAFGWGLPARESIEACLERRLASDRRTNGRHVTVVNLGSPGQGMYGILADLEDYTWLDYDVVIVYEGYNDLGLNDTPARHTVPNYMRWRRESPIFRATGYYPILPIILRDRAVMLWYGDDVAAQNAAQRITFRPGLAARATATAMVTAARLSEELGRLSEPPPTPSVDERCVPKWQQYCGAAHDVVAWALARHKHVIFVTQPFVSDAHVEQQANVTAMLRARFGNDPHLDLVDLGRLIDLTDHQIAFDGIHLVAAGNDRVAAALVSAVLRSL